MRQVAPTIEDLTDRAVQAGPLIREFPTGSWGDESRDYHVAVRCRRSRSAPSSSSSRVQLVVGDEVVGQGLVKATWSDDSTLTTRINPAVAHYTGQAELASAIQEGLAAKAAGDDATATLKLGRAAQLAAETGDDEATNRLKRVVDIEDAETGTVRLKREGVEARRDGARHQLDQDDAGALMSLRLPAGPPVVAPPTSATCAASPSTPTAPSAVAPSPPARAGARSPRRAGRRRRSNLPDPTAPRARRARTARPRTRPTRSSARLRLRLHHRPAARAAGRRGTAARAPTGSPSCGSTPTGSTHQDAPGGCADERRADRRAAAGDDHHRSGAGPKSRNLSPDIDCSGDGAVSHQHAELTLDRDRWYVEDLGSTNGTFVGAPGDPLPDDAARRRTNVASSPTTSASTSAPGPASWSAAPPTTRRPAHRLTLTQKRSDASVSTGAQDVGELVELGVAGDERRRELHHGSPRSSARAINPDS